MRKTITKGTKIVLENPEKVNPLNTFEALKRDFEAAYASGNDFTEALYALARGVAYSVLKKCLDPQRKTAPMRDAISDNGQTSPLIECRRSIARDTANLEHIRDALNRAYKLTVNDKGETVNEVADRKALEAADELMRETLGDGLDIVHNAVVAILEQAAEHAGDGEKWLDIPRKEMRLDKRVRINLDTSAARKEVEITPIQDIYRATRATVIEARSGRVNASGYSYVAGTDAGGEEVYYRLPKYSDLGGDGTGRKRSALDMHTSDAGYSADVAGLEVYAALKRALRFTKRQALIFDLRVAGYGDKAIARYFGITKQAVQNQRKRIVKLALDKGITPDYIPPELLSDDDDTDDE